MAYENYNIQQFMNAWFKKDYSELSEEEFKVVYAEYQDTSGLFITEDFERQSYIHHLNSRINYIKILLVLQRRFIVDFGMPFIRDFEYLKQQYGYVLIWDGNIDNFESQLKKIESREIKHTSFLEAKVKELHDSRKENQNKGAPDDNEESLIKSRLSFIRMLNSLGKIGFRVDKKDTSVEELSLMIKQQLEENDSLKNR